MGAPVVMIGAPDMMGAAAAAEEVMMGTPVVVAGVYALMPPVVMMGVAVVDGTVMIGAAVSIVTLGRMCETVGSFKTLRNAAESTNCEGMMSKLNRCVSNVASNKLSSSYISANIHF